VVESQPSKLLVAGSIPVSRSIRRSRLHSPASYGWQAILRQCAQDVCATGAREFEATVDLSAVARVGAFDSEGEGRCSSVGRARPW
jgi:hypothetical protein